MATLFEYLNTGGDDYEDISGASPQSDAIWAGQTFTPSIAHTITEVKLLAWRELSPGTLTVRIRATDGSGLPTGADLASGTYNANTLTTNPAGEWITITLSAGYALSAGVKYAIVVTVTGTGLNNFNWIADSSSPTYSGGNTVFSDADAGTTWTANTGRDFMFEEWGLGLVSGNYIWIEADKLRYIDETSLLERATKYEGEQETF